MCLCLVFVQPHLGDFLLRHPSDSNPSQQESFYSIIVYHTVIKEIIAMLLLLLPVHTSQMKIGKIFLVKTVICGIIQPLVCYDFLIHLENDIKLQ